MSVVVNIEQNQKSIKKIGLKFLSSWTNYENQYFGVPNQAYVIDNYEGEEDIRNQLFVLYNKEKFGRGISFIVDDEYNIELVLNYPATKTDIEMFYKFIKDICMNFKIETFTCEGDSYTLNQIDQLMRDSIQFNQDLVKTGIKPGLTIFGCIYPIVVEDEFFNEIRDLCNEDAYEYFEKYLNEKQIIDCYYAKPLLYKAPRNKILAKYALTENVPTIFPMKEHLPFGYNQELKDDIIHWSVFLVQEVDGKLQPSEELEYHEFCNMFEIDKLPKFDADHVIITFTSDMLLKINSFQIKQATIHLEEWLSDVRELGHKPFKIEHTTAFVDEDGINCHIFKYKKSILSKWYLGIVSDSGTFSEMKEYNKNTEIDDAKAIVNKLKEIWKRRAKELN